MHGLGFKPLRKSLSQYVIGGAKVSRAETFEVDRSCLEALFLPPEPLNPTLSHWLRTRFDLVKACWRAGHAFGDDGWAGMTRMPRIGLPRFKVP